MKWSYIWTTDFNLSSFKKKPEKIQAWTGIELMTSAIPAQRSNQPSYQANWELVIWEFVFIL